MFRYSVLCLFFCLTYLLVGRSVIKQIYCFLCVRFQRIAIGRTNRRECIIASFQMGHFSRLSLTVFPSSISMQQNEFDSNVAQDQIDPNYL